MRAISSRSELRRVQLAQVTAQRPQLGGLGLRAPEVPVLEHLARRVLLDQPLDHLADLAREDVGHVPPLEDLPPVLVDHPALLVHHVVVLEHALADQEVLLLDLLLGVLDRAAEHLRLERVLLAVLVDGAQPVEDLVDPVAGEQPDQLVLGRQVEARLAGSPWRPERPRSWLSIRRDSWRSVPQMNSPPSSITFSPSASHRSWNLGRSSASSCS